jgi:hypothetical protein
LKWPEHNEAPADEEEGNGNNDNNDMDDFNRFPPQHASPPSSGKKSEDSNDESEDFNNEREEEDFGEEPWMDIDPTITDLKYSVKFITTIKEVSLDSEIEPIPK